MLFHHFQKIRYTLLDTLVQQDSLHGLLRENQPLVETKSILESCFMTASFYQPQLHLLHVLTLSPALTKVISGYYGESLEAMNLHQWHSARLSPGTMNYKNH